MLDIGPGDGTLFRMLERRVGTCVGVDPSEHAVDKLNRLFADRPDVSFVLGGLPELPDLGEVFDIVVANSVLMILANEDEIATSLRSMATWCRIGGACYIGELHARSERRNGLLGQVGSIVRNYGVGGALRGLWQLYLEPVVKGDPILVEPVGATVVVEPDRFLALASDAGFQGRWSPHRELRRDSPTRADYLLERIR